MTYNEWILYCIIVATAIAVVVYFFHDYPIHDAIDQTRYLVIGAP